MAGRPSPIPPGAIEVRPATAERWPDIVTLLGGNDERGCWCQSWRGSRRGDGAPPGNRARLEAQVRSGTFAPGVIAYLDGTPVGWCGLGPRAAMPRLVGSRTIPRVDDAPAWSIGCFVVRPGYRRRGVARALLRGAVEYARSQGAPVRRGLPDRPRRRSGLRHVRLHRLHRDVRSGRLPARAPHGRPQRGAPALARAPRPRLTSPSVRPSRPATRAGGPGSRRGEGRCCRRTTACRRRAPPRRRSPGRRPPR